MATSEACTSDICDGCEITLKKFLSLTENESALYEFLFTHGVLPRSRTCECGGTMTVCMERKSFKCYKKIVIAKPKTKKKIITCGKEKSIFCDTWFERSEISVSTVCSLVSYWCFWRPPRQVFLNSELKISSNAIWEWMNYLRELCVWEVSSTREQLGGAGKVVEISEAKFGKKRYDRISVLVGERIFTAYEHGSQKIFVTGMADRSAATLCSIIRQHILPGTTIISDKLSLYNPLQHQDFIHLAVSHSINFVDLNSSDRTHNLWREVRVRIPKYGDRKLYAAGEVCEFLYRYKYFNKHDTRLHHVFQTIAKWYNGSSQTRPSSPNSD